MIPREKYLPKNGYLTRLGWPLEFSLRAVALAAVLSGAAHGDHRDDIETEDLPNYTFATVHVPLLLAPSVHDPVGGVLHIINQSPGDSYARIYAIDDTGQRFESSDWWFYSQEARTITAAELEEGEKYTPAPDGWLDEVRDCRRTSACRQGGEHHGGLGDGIGHWRLEIKSHLDLEVLAYARSAEGDLVSTTHDAVSETTPLNYRVPIFNGGTWRARLRLSNLDMAESATALITGIDSEGVPAPGGEVEITIPPGATCTVSSRALETGDGIACEATGWLGNGTGKWRLFIAADRPIDVLNLLVSRAGHITNLSTSPHIVPYTATGERRECTNERELALQFNAAAVKEWDGTPFRVDMFDNFPDYVSRGELLYLLAPIGRLADQIEKQIGYRIIEMGDVIAVPPGMRPDGALYTLREAGQLLAYHNWGTAQLGAVMDASPSLGMMRYSKETITSWWPEESGWPEGGWPEDSGYLYEGFRTGANIVHSRDGEVIVHEVFHLLGFRHPHDPFTKEEGRTGVPMVKGPLWKPSRVGAWVNYPAWDDIDALRCIFPVQ